jgi:hypothetical protein
VLLRAWLPVVATSSGLAGNLSAAAILQAVLTARLNSYSPCSAYFMRGSRNKTYKRFPCKVREHNIYELEVSF